MHKLMKIGKWIVLTPFILLAGALNLDDYVLFLKDILHGKQQHEGKAVYNQIERIRS
ncbi:hypothetical protein [Paenibacillus wulumuqiensis]|uniref:hypothetical protein n=1 Tax=Paenibacillus wulumuqiensis TaxID=1567107 RepID=UPI000ADC1F5C|nr:hypothetical protein [Paenibacillus wulumuqiensis]